jgi:hypothetical protein
MKSGYLILGIQAKSLVEQYVRENCSQTNKSWFAVSEKRAKL